MPTNNEIISFAKRALNPGVNRPYEAGQWYVLIERWYLAIALFYLELVFKLSTRTSLLPSILVIALFSIAAGQLFYVLASFGDKHVNTIVKAVVLGVLGLMFTVEYFVYRQFNDFYSVKTVVAGAGGVAGGFMGDVLGLIFSLRGLAHILLFFLPLILHLIQARYNVDRARRADWPTKASALAVVVVAHLVAVLFLALSGPFGQAYFAQYNFHTAAPNYGLLTAVRKDITASESVTFQNVDPNAQDDAANNTPTSYDKAVMDIDFKALAESTWDEQYQELDNYVASLTPSSENEMTGRFSGYNLIFISAEAFSHAAMSPTLTPTLWRMYTKGIIFTDYYQFESAGTTGGECQNILGMLPVDGGESMKEVAYSNNYFATGSFLNRLGYNGWAFHNNDYTFYDRVETHNNLGYNNGYMGYGNGMEEYVTEQWPQSDLEMVKGTFDNIYCDKEPFNVYYMSVSGHSGYSFEGNAMSKKNWDAVQELDYNDDIKAYIAANLELEYAMAYLVDQLEARGMARHTLIVITADHFPYGLDEGVEASDGNVAELYGKTIEDYFDRDQNALIMWSASLEDDDPIIVRDPTCSLDILPTLCNLFGVEWDSRLLPGRDVFSDAYPVIFNAAYCWKTPEGKSLNGVFYPNEGSTVEDADSYYNTYATVVANKTNYCRGVIAHDYYSHVFGPNPDVNAVHDAAVEEGLALHRDAVERTQASANAAGADGEDADAANEGEEQAG